MGRTLFWLAAALCTAVATHALVVLLIPDFTLKPVIARLSRDAGSNSFFMLAENDQRTLFPFSPQVSVAGACAFDVSKGPVELTASLPPGFWTLTIYSSRGDVIYVLNDSQSGTGSFTVRLNRAPGLIDMLSAAQQENPQNATGWTVDTSDPRGLAVVWQPLADAALRPASERAIAATLCAPKVET